MSPGQDYTNRLLENVRQTLAPQTAGLEDDFRDLQNYLSSSIFPRLQEKLAALREVEFPSLASIVAESMEAVVRQNNAEKALLARFSREVRQKETQGEILALLLEIAHSFAPRVALFVLRGEQLAGWSSRGYSDEIASGIQSCSLPRSAEDIFHTAVEADGQTSITELSQEHPLRKSTGDNFEGPLHLVPLRAMQRPVALVVAQDANQQTCDLESLCALLEITGLCIENIALKILQEIQVEATASPRAASVERDDAAIEPVEASRPILHGEDARVAEAISAPADTPEPQPVTTAGIELATEANVATAEGEAEATAETETAAPIPPLVSEEPQPAPSAAETKEPQPVSEEEKLHGEAKRFARLLVSEIKLYNEQRVMEGRHNRDLYVRLKRDIDRSREMYEKRISPVVSRKIDYFHDEVIRILGENDPSTLGSDYPGPRVES